MVDASGAAREPSAKLLASLEAQLASFYQSLDADSSRGVVGGSPPAEQPFVSSAVQQRAARLTAEEADSLSYGAIRLADDGTIEIYNQRESELAGFDAADAIGSNFFTELAPCTNNRLFHGRFVEGVAADHMDVVFPYTFTYRMAPTLVTIHLLRVEGVNWVFVNKES